MPTGKLGVLFLRADRKVTQWRHFRQREYANRVVKTIRAGRLGHLPMVLINDPELAVVLREAFPRGRIVHWFQNQQESKPRFRSLFAGAVDAVAGCSNFISRWAEGYYGLPKASVKTLYNGVDASAFAPAEHEPQGVPVVNFVGRTGIEKAPDLVLKAALRIARKTNHFGVQLIGSNHWDRFEMDVYQQQLIDLTREVEAAGINVRRPGHIGRRDLPREFRKAHVHVVPSRWDEPSALTIYEGMACGLATVASRTGGTPEIVNEHGLLFERDSVEGLASASLRTFYPIRQLRRRLRGLHARRAGAGIHLGTRVGRDHANGMVALATIVGSVPFWDRRSHGSLKRPRHQCTSVSSTCPSNTTRPFPAGRWRPFSWKRRASWKR